MEIHKLPLPTYFLHTLPKNLTDLTVEMITTTMVEAYARMYSYYDKERDLMHTWNGRMLEAFEGVVGEIFYQSYIDTEEDETWSEKLWQDFSDYVADLSEMRDFERIWRGFERVISPTGISYPYCPEAPVLNKYQAFFFIVDED